MMYTYDFFWYSGARTDFVYAAGSAILLDVYEDPSPQGNDVLFQFRNVIDNGYDSSSIVNVFFDTGTAGSTMFTDLAVWDQSPGGGLTEPGDLAPTNSFLNFTKIAFTAEFSAGRESGSYPKTVGVNPGEYLTVRGVLGDSWTFDDVVNALSVGMNDSYNDALYWDQLPTSEKDEYREFASTGLRVSILLHSVVPNSVNPDGHGLFVTDGLVSVTGDPGAGGEAVPGTPDDDVLDPGDGAQTMSGYAGDDTYVVDDLGDVVIEQPDEGYDTVQSSVSFTLPANVEKLVLSGPGAIRGSGNELDNLIVAGDGDNFLDGKGGQDTVSYADATAGVTVSLATTVSQATGGSGTDTVLNFENLTGSALNDTLSGNSGANVIDGGAGADLLSGGTGNDIYIVDNSGDIITDTGGVDTVRSSINCTLGANLENLILLSGALEGTGNALANVLTGNGANNVLRGLAGNDTLDGGGGDDTLIGGAGNDTYIVDGATEVIFENAGEGTDTVVTSVSYTLGSNLENLTLAGSAAIDSTGNELKNVLTGNAENNVLRGLGGNDTLDGGGGVDTLVGGLGNDTYVVDSTTDFIIENPGEGTDTVKSIVTYTLADNSSLENLTLSGSAAIYGTGNVMNNYLTGNAGDNVLRGLGGNDTLNGGGGIDTLIGGSGNDTYVVDTTTDVIIENLGEGTDTVKSGVTYTLADGSNLENLTLTGSAAIDGTGNELGNTLTGNTGSNQLDGRAGNDVLVGGRGTDYLRGGLGADRFDFNALNETVVGAARDEILDFSRLEGDKIDLATLDAITGVSGNQAFTFIGDAAFSAAGQIRFADGIVQGNVNGDAVADFEIGLIGVTSLTASDFIA
jgi:serralysin